MGNQTLVLVQLQRHVFTSSNATLENVHLCASVTCPTNGCEDCGAPDHFGVPW